MRGLILLFLGAFLGASLTAAEPVEIKVEAAASLLAEGEGVTVLDIRTPEEFAEGHLAGAKNLDFTEGDFEERLAQLDRSKPYLVHCASGRRRSQAMEVFKKLRFTRIHHLVDGYKGWVDAGNAVVK